MNYELIKEVIELVQQFEIQNENKNHYSNDVDGFKEWIAASAENTDSVKTPDWEGKEKGRSPESVISTLIVHMNRYAKSYSKSAINDSMFSSQEDFIYLITLKSFGSMSKTELIKANVHDKPAGIQTDSDTDKRTKVIKITEKGLKTLDDQMDKIRKATQIVTGDLTHREKMELIFLLSKLNDFHHSIYCKNLEPKELLDIAYDQLSKN